MTIVTTAWQRDATTGEVIFDAAGNPLPVVQPGANTLGDMVTRVLYETLGPATEDDARNAIIDAIREYEQSSFYWNDMRTFGGSTGSLSNLTTQPGKEFYSYQDLPVLINMPHIRSLLVVAFSNRYELTLRTQQWIDQQSISTVWKGWPTDYCLVAGGLRIYPIPSETFPFIITGTVRLPLPAADTDTSPWLNEAEMLIRTRAKQLIYENIARDADQAAVMAMQINGNPNLGTMGYLAQLRRETQRRAGGTGKLRPSRGYF